MTKRHIAASVRARLLNHAREAKQDFNLVLTRFCLERLLYRISVSNCMLAPFYVERSMLVIEESPTLILVSIQLTAEDIVNETIHIAPFIKSISLQ